MWVVKPAETIVALLKWLPPHIGKHRARGFGALLGWEIAPVEFAERATYELDGKLIKNVPRHAVYDYDIAPPIPVGWTPPHWKPALFSRGYRVGTRVGAADDVGSFWRSTDFFNGIEALMNGGA